MSATDLAAIIVVSLAYMVSTIIIVGQVGKAVRRIERGMQNGKHFVYDEEAVDGAE